MDFELKSFFFVQYYFRLVWYGAIYYLGVGLIWEISWREAWENLKLSFFKFLEKLPEKLRKSSEKAPNFPGSPRTSEKIQWKNSSNYWQRFSTDHSPVSPYNSPLLEIKKVAIPATFHKEDREILRQIFPLLFSIW